MGFALGIAAVFGVDRFARPTDLELATRTERGIVGDGLAGAEGEAGRFR